MAEVQMNQLPTTQKFLKGATSSKSQVTVESDSAETLSSSPLNPKATAAGRRYLSVSLCGVLSATHESRVGGRYDVVDP